MIKDITSEQLEDFLLSTCVDETGVPGNGTLWEFSNGTNVLTYEGHRHVFFWRSELIILDKETDTLDESTIMNLGRAPCALPKRLTDIAASLRQAHLNFLEAIIAMTNSVKEGL